MRLKFRSPLKTFANDEKRHFKIKASLTDRISSKPTQEKGRDLMMSYLFWHKLREKKIGRRHINR